MESQPLTFKWISPIHFGSMAASIAMEFTDS